VVNQNSTADLVGVVSGGATGGGVMASVVEFFLHPAIIILAIEKRIDTNNIINGTDLLVTKLFIL